MFIRNDFYLGGMMSLVVETFTQEIGNIGVEDLDLSPLCDFSESGGRLVLYFDLNKTLLATDVASGKTQDMVLNNILSEQYQSCWEEGMEQTMSFYDYVKEYLVPGEKFDPEVKSARTQLSGNFVSWLKEHRHPLYKEVHDHVQRLQKALVGHTVFPSFFRLLDVLNQVHCQAHIVLRTFGEDLEDTVACIEKTVPEIKFSFKGRFSKREFHGEDVQTEDLRQVLAYFLKHTYSAVQDDYHYWHGNREHYSFSKPLLFNEKDSSQHCMFFDDNVKCQPCVPKNIVAPISVNTGAVSEEAYAGFIERRQIVQVNTVEAIGDINYYVKEVLSSIKEKISS